MKKSMVYLPEETYEGLRKLAFEAKISVAELIRRAVDIVYGEDIEDIRDMEQEIARYQAQPGTALALEEYLRRRKGERGDVIEVKGYPASGGVAEGIARVITDVSQLKEVQPGDILVCGSTDPMWTPAFVKIKGVVTDVGGAMDYAGIIAREHGLPAIVGTTQATRIIKTGDRIKIDGASGVVLVER
jgi:phosphoenolpyruvate synthase/pyruvate phosphate dikinase